jgi:hypothetical protein
MREQAQRQEEEQELAELFALEPLVDGAVGRRLGDADYLTAVLRGRRAPARGDSKRIATLMSRRLTGLDRCLGLYRDLPEKVERLQQAGILQLAMAPDRLLLLDDYLARIEARIEHKTTDLRLRLE